MPQCRNCQSDHKIAEIDPGIFLCPGYCRKEFLAEKNKGRATTLAEPNKEKTMADAKNEAAGAATAVLWKVDDFCRATWQEDNVVYEATIDSIEEAEDGKSYCVVTFLGYNNKETVYLKELKPSRGSAARKQQITESAADENANHVVPAEEWKVGDFCRAVYAADNLEYEGIIKEVDKDDAGTPFATVEYVGYLNQESQWFTALMQSLGDKARAKQETEAAAEVAEEENNPLIEPEPEKPKSVETPEKAIIAEQEIEVALNEAKAENPIIAPEPTKKMDPIVDEKRELIVEENKRLIDEKIAMTHQIEALRKGNSDLQQRLAALTKGNSDLKDDLMATKKSINDRSSEETTNEVAIANLRLAQEKNQELDELNKKLTKDNGALLKDEKVLLEKIDQLKKELKAAKTIENANSTVMSDLDEIARQDTPTKSQPGSNAMMNGMAPMMNGMMPMALMAPGGDSRGGMLYVPYPYMMPPIMMPAPPHSQVGPNRGGDLDGASRNEAGRN